MNSLYHVRSGDRLFLEEENGFSKIVSVTRVTGKGKGIAGRIYAGDRKFGKDGREVYDGGATIRSLHREEERKL